MTRDPYEGIAPDGTIVTGASRARVPPQFEQTLSEAQKAIEEAGVESLYLYGSVATGQARLGESDLDLLATGLENASAIAGELSNRLRKVVRGVEISVIELDNSATDQAYGDKVFLRHYCVPLSGEDVTVGWPRFPADARAARGFNGDIGLCAQRWRAMIELGETQHLARKIARKSLLALAGLVSVQQGIWTTDRQTAAALYPGQTAELQHLSESDEELSRPELRRLLGGAVAEIVHNFRLQVGLWEEGPRV